MATVDVLIAVNVEQALSLIPNIASAIFMMDSNGYVGGGSSGEGGDELITAVANGDTIMFTVVPIQPSGVVSIQRFTRYPSPAKKVHAIPDHMDPVRSALDPRVWVSKVEFLPSDKGKKFQYSVVLEFENGKSGTYDPYITPQP